MKFKKVMEHFFETPAAILEDGIEAIEKEEKKILSKKPFRIVQEYANTLGPGLVTGAADDDPSGIATYSQTGAQYGFSLLWLSLFTFPLMAVVQEMCARIGLVTGAGLASNIRKHYPAWVLYSCTLLLFVANTFNLGADLGAMAAGTRLIAPNVPAGLLVVLFAIGILLLQIFTTYARYAKYLKYLTLVLLSYVATAFLVHLDWSRVLLSTLIPHLAFSKDEILLTAAILGTTISPYLFFWQTSQEVEEEILRGERTVKEREASVTPKEIRAMRADVWTGMFVSNAVMFFIIAVCATTLAAHGVTNITSAAAAAAALLPLAGRGAYLLFAIGIIGTGLLAVPVLAGSISYAISESFRWKTGLYRKLKDAYAFYGVLIVSMLVGLLINFIGLDPIKALIYSSIANALVAPIILVLVVELSSSKKLMRSHANHPFITSIGWVTIALLAIAGIMVVATI